jgi:AsmA protein
MAETPIRGRLARRIVVGVAIAVGALVALVVALALLVDSGAVTTRVVNLVVPRVSESLGREVAVRGAHLKLFPQTRVRLEGFSVAGRQGEPPLLETQALDVEMALWPLLRSLGKDVQVRALSLDRPAANLIRSKDGTWNYEGLGGKAEKGPQPAAPPAEKARVVVSRFSIRGGSVRVVDATRPGGEAGIALQAIDLDMTGVGPGLPVGLNLSAALGSDRPNLSLEVSAASLPAALPQRPEDWPAVQGTLRAGPLALDRVAPLLPAGIHGFVQGGTANLDARVSTQNGAYHVDGSGALRDLRLRGQPASGSFRASATVPPAQPGRARLEIQNLQVKGPGVDLGGNAVAEANPIRIRFAIDGPLLDLDALMGALPPSAPATGPKATGGSPIPPSMRQEIDAASATGSLDVGEVRSGKLRATQVHARVSLQRGVLTVQQAGGGVYGGSVDLSGTQATLTEPEPSWKLRAKVQGLDVGEATRTFVGTAPVTGKSNVALDLAGKGIEWQRVRNAITGAVGVELRNGVLTTADLATQTLSALSAGLKALGQGGGGFAGVASGKTELKDLQAHFIVKDGWMTLSQPLRTQTPIGPMELSGRIGLDMRLDLTGKVGVPKAVLAGISLPRFVQLPASIPVPVTIGGTLTAPSLSVRADQAIAGLAKGQASAATKALREEGEKAAKEGLGGLLKQFGGKQ